MDFMGIASSDVGTWRGREMGNLYEEYLVFDSFTLGDAAFLFRELHPDRPGMNIDHGPVRLLVEKLMLDKDRLQARFRGEEGQESNPNHWTATRENLKDWARRTNLRPLFLFPRLPELIGIDQFLSEESYKASETQKHLIDLAYYKARNRIAQEISNGKLKAYVYDSEGDPEMMTGDHEYMEQIRSFLREGEKRREWTEYVEHSVRALGVYERERSVIINLDWVSYAYIPSGQDSQDQESMDFADHPSWPEELGIAMTVWRAAINQVQKGETPKSFMRNWLERHYPGRSSEFYDRITIVANWDKSPGAKRKN
jgi:hypothetical protein